MTVQTFLLTLLMLAGRGNGGLLKYGFVLSIPLLLIGLIALVVTIIKFVKMFKDAQIARVPLGASSEINITKIGDLSLMMQIPATALYVGQNLDYQLIERANGQNIELHEMSPFSTSRRNSFQTRTFPVRTFKIDKTGNYLLRVNNFNPQASYENYFLIVEETTNTKAVLYILTLILTAAMTISGFILTFVSLKSNR